MKEYFNKILEVYEPSYKQLRVMFIISIGIIGILFTMNRTEGIASTRKDITVIQNDLKEIKEDLKKIDNKFYNNVENFNNELYNLYRELLNINFRTDELWNIKFNLFIEYGHDKELLKELIKIQTKQRKLYEEERMDRMKYNILEPDSLN